MQDHPPEATSQQTYLDELESAIKRACDDAGPDVRAGLAASIEVCADAKQRLLVQIREANHHYGIQHADHVLVRDMPAELQTLNRLYRQIEWRIDDIREVMSRVVVAPDGETIVLPRGHSFAGFSDDGKVISGRMTVVCHEDRRRVARTRTRPAERRTRQYRPRGARRTASSSRTSSADPGGDSDGPGEPAPATLRVRRPSGATATFRADDCSIEAGVVTAVGSWDDLPGERQYSWPARRVLQVQWLEVVA